MRHMILRVGVFVVLSSSPSYAQQNTELGVEQKLRAVYELYRTGDQVTLDKQEMRVNLDFFYLVEEDNQLGIRSTDRTFGATASLAYGLTDTIELLASVPYLLTDREAESAELSFVDESDQGLGDVVVGAAFALPTSGFNTTLLTSVRLPTGSGGIGDDGLGTNVGVNLDLMLRPAFVYGGISWLQEWEEGNASIGYTAGIGFLLNYALSFGAELNGAVALNPDRGDPRDVVSVRFPVSYQVTPSFGVTPSVSAGLVDNAPDAVIDLELVWRF